MKGKEAVPSKEGLLQLIQTSINKIDSNMYLEAAAKDFLKYPFLLLQGQVLRGGISFKEASISWTTYSDALDTELENFQKQVDQILKELENQEQSRHNEEKKKSEKETGLLSTLRGFLKGK